MYNEIGNRLYELRMKHGLSGVKAAVKIGVPLSKWYRWENGETCLTSYYIILICKKFGVSADWLLGLDGSAGEADAETD